MQGFDVLASSVCILGMIVLAAVLTVFFGGRK